MTQVGEGPGGWYEPAPATGDEVLADRYRLEQHVNTDSAGRQIWRGSDVILRRPVAVLIRYPGGEAAAPLLQTAVEASRIVHPNLVGVFDAIDEHTRAYVVREWIDGASLRDRLDSGTFDATQAVAVAHAVSAAVNALHMHGLTHGNVHPGTVLIDLDGRVVLADARGEGVPAEEDVRAVGALLYYALTGYWPYAEVAGPGGLPDAIRDNAGTLAAPRQVRAGIPDHLDNLTMDLLDRRLTAPSADLLTGELAHLDAQPEPYHLAPDAPYDGQPLDASTGPIRFPTGAERPPAKSSGRKVVLGLSGLLAAGVVGLLVGLTWLTGGSPPDPPPGGPSGGASAPPDATRSPEEIALDPSQVRVVDPPQGDRAELDDVALVVDGDLTTSWRTDRYNSAQFGGIKPGMGILINLGEPRHVASVRVELGTPGATAEVRVGDEDPGSSPKGDDEVYQTYTPVGEQQQGGTTMVFSAFDAEQTYQYLMVWFIDLPPDGDKFRVEVQQVVVEGY